MAAWGCRGAAVSEDRRWSGAGATGAGAGGVDGDKHAGRRRGGGGQTHGHGPRPTADLDGLDFCHSTFPYMVHIPRCPHQIHPALPPSHSAPFALFGDNAFISRLLPALIHSFILSLAAVLSSPRRPSHLLSRPANAGGSAPAAGDGV